MSDTVSGAVIVSSLGNDGPAFLFLSDPTDVAGLGAVHVHGAAYTEPVSLGLLVDFGTLSPDLKTVTPQAGPDDAPASVSGAAIVLLPDEPPLGVPGALHQG